MALSPRQYRYYKSWQQLRFRRGRGFESPEEAQLQNYYDSGLWKFCEFLKEFDQIK